MTCPNGERVVGRRSHAGSEIIVAEISSSSETAKFCWNHGWVSEPPPVTCSPELGEHADLGLTVRELKQKLSLGEFDSRLDELLAAENESDRPRITAIEAIQSRIEGIDATTEDQ